MAVRTTWTAGDVLTAADLTDTFGAKANLASPTFTGTPAAPTAAAGTNTTQVATTAFVQAASGLTLITTQSFSAVSSVSVNNCFSGDYDNYRIIITMSTTQTDAPTMRLRAGGADSSAASYNTRRIYTLISTGSSNGDGSATETSFKLGSADTTKGLIALDVTLPQAAERTAMFAHSIGVASGGNGYFTYAAGVFNAATQFDGFSILNATMTGSLSVFGYRK